MTRLDPGQNGEHITFCRICEAVCGLVVTVRDGAAIAIAPDKANPHSKGHLCVKGANAHRLAHDPDRLLYPMRRNGRPGEFERIGWDDALREIASRWTDGLSRHGARSYGSYWGNPAAFSSEFYRYGNGLLADLGVTRTFSAASLDSNSRHAASFVTFGAAGRIPTPDLPHADCLFIFGSNPLVSNGSIMTCPTIKEKLDGIASRGRVVVFDPRLSETAKRYEHVAIRPGSDAYVLAAMVRQICVDGLIVTDTITHDTVGWERLRHALDPFCPKLAEERSGVDADRIVNLARYFAAADRGAVYGRVGIGRARHATAATFLTDVLNIVTGKFGKKGGWIFGDSPLSGGKLPAAFERVETRFGRATFIFGMQPVTMLADEIATPGVDQIKSFLMIAGNPVLSAPAGNKLAVALEGLDLFVSIDTYMNESNRFADFLLPATTFLERGDLPLQGLNYMAEPFIQRTSAVLPPQGECKTETEILMAMRRVVGSGAGELDHAHGTDALTGEILDLFEEAGWPSADDLADHPHGIMMGELRRDDWRQKISHPDGKLHLWHDLIAEELESMASSPHPATDLLLFGRRDIRSINSWGHNIDRLVRSQDPRLLMHPDDAAARSLSDDDEVEVCGPGGCINAVVQVSTEVVRGAISYPHGWGHNGGWQRANRAGGANINLILEGGLPGADPVSGVARLEGVPVTVVPVRRSPRDHR